MPARLIGLLAAAASALTLQATAPAPAGAVAPTVGSVWTSNAGRAMRVARALETGTISINSNNSVRVTTPFGGFKQSGIGRELGPNALDHYTELKNVFLSTS
jgi:acyl-CoA reductase-like NAD-dependent aldehyde dehydrogenase